MNKETNKREEKKTKKYFESPRLEIMRILIDELQGWESSKKVKTEEMYRLIDRLLPSLPQNGDREKEACLHEVIGIDYDPANKPHGYCMSDGCKRAFNIGSFPPSPSEGKEKEPKEIPVPMNFAVKLPTDTPIVIKKIGQDRFGFDVYAPSALAEKETAPKPDCEERVWKKNLRKMYDENEHERYGLMEAFIQTLLKEKEEDAYRKGYDEGFYNGQNIKPF